MTVPAGGGATTIAPAAPAVMLTEYAPGSTAPLYVINQSADRVWLGGDSSVGPSNGTPVEGFTSVPWTTAGQLWIVADAGAAAPISIVVSTDISNWQPSPAAIGVEVAQQLLATGVPNVLLTETIAAGYVLPAGATRAFDVARFASLRIHDITTPADETIDLEAGYDHVNAERIYMTKVLTGGPRSVTLAVLGAELELVNSSGVAVTLTIEGSNRAVRERIDLRSDTSAGDGWRLTLPAGIGSYDLIQLTDGVCLQGECRGAFSVDPDVVGEFRLNYTGVSLTVCDTAQMFASADGDQRAMINFALPATDYSISFEVHGGAAAGAAGKVAAVRILPVAY